MSRVKTKTGGPEFLIIPPRGEDASDPSFLAMVEKCVEKGYYFEFDPGHRLPDYLPGDLSGFKAVVLDPALDWVRREPASERLAAFEGRGGVVRFFNRIPDFRRDLENPIISFVDKLAASALLTPCHPAMHERLGRRDDRALLEAQVETMLDPEAYRPRMDQEMISGWNLRQLGHAAAYFESGELLRRLADWVEIDAARPRRHNPPENYLLLHRLTGEGQYLERVKSILARRLEERTTADGCLDLASCRSPVPWVSCDGCAGAAHFAALGGYVGDERYIDIATGYLRRAHALISDPEDQLWWHGIQGGRPAAAKWARGQGWALRGICETMASLPEKHPDREWISARLGDIARGLSRCQEKETGLWHNVLTVPGSGLETSSAAIVVENFSKAWKAGWCREPFLPEMIGRAWTGVKSRVFRHRLTGFVPGTEESHDLHYYVARPRLSIPGFAVSASIAYIEAFG